MSNIYGVNTNGKVTEVMIRDAIVNCFVEVHCSQTELGEPDSPEVVSYCKEIVKKAFDEVKGDYDNPKKTELNAVMKWLAEFSMTFRDVDLIKQHMRQIEILIEKIKE